MKGLYMSIKELDREQLLGVIEDFAKNWLAHDGLWLHFFHFIL